MGGRSPYWVELLNSHCCGYCPRVLLIRFIYASKNFMALQFFVVAERRVEALDAFGMPTRRSKGLAVENTGKYESTFKSGDGGFV
jgi:hypothetical protein